MLRKRTKTERNALYLDSLASNVLATLKEGFAVCPALGAISILVVRRDPLPTGGEQLVAIYAATFSRQSIADVDWPRIDLAMAIDQPGDRLLHFKGQAHSVTALDLRGEPELQVVLEALAAVLDMPALAPL
jgi:hypothetical protein